MLYWKAEQLERQIENRSEFQKHSIVKILQIYILQTLYNRITTNNTVPS